MAASRNSELDPSVRYLHCVVPEMNTDFGHTLTPFEQFGRLLEAHGFFYGHKVLECSSIGGLQHRPRLWEYGLHPGNYSQSRCGAGGALSSGEAAQMIDDVGDCIDQTMARLRLGLELKDFILQPGHPEYEKALAAAKIKTLKNEAPSESEPASKRRKVSSKPKAAKKGARDWKELHETFWNAHQELWSIGPYVPVNSDRSCLGEKYMDNFFFRELPNREADIVRILDLLHGAPEPGAPESFVDVLPVERSRVAIASDSLQFAYG